MNDHYDTPTEFHPVSGVPLRNDRKRIAEKSDEYTVIKHKLLVANIARIKEQREDREAALLKRDVL